jgi:hypothetical protein
MHQLPPSCRGAEAPFSRLHVSAEAQLDSTLEKYGCYRIRSDDPDAPGPVLTPEPEPRRAPAPWFFLPSPPPWTRGLAR